jgi:predicted TIM-barrel enzyme
MIVIVKRTSRTEILAKLQSKIQRRIPILISSAGSGLVATLLEKAGADCINTFSGARLRGNGMGTMSMLWPILDSNKQTLDYTEEDIMPAINGDAFICACINANDPLKDMTTVLNRLKGMAVFSVSNIGPSISYYDKDSQIYKILTSAGITFDHEVQMLKLAKEMDMVTVALAFDLEDSLQIVEEADPDIFCFHAGTTKGGLMGYDSGEVIQGTAERTEEVYKEVLKIKPDLIKISHGAAMETPEEAQYMLNHTSSEGIWTGSSTERIPIERAVLETATEFAQLRYQE